MGIQSRFCTISYELRSSFLAIRESFGSRWKADIVGMRTAKEARERRRARAAERRALDALAARIRSTALDGYEASHGDGGDTSDARRVDAHRNENEDARTEPPTTSALHDVQRERDALLLRVEHLERAAARTRPLPSRASPSAPPRDARRVRRPAGRCRLGARRGARGDGASRARIADLERTAPARAAALEEATRARVAEAVAEERARGDARLRAAADAVAEAHHAKVAADARGARAPPRRRSARSSGSRGSRCRKRARGRGARAAERSHIVGGRDRACERAGGVRGRAAALARDVDELTRAAAARWGGGWNAFLFDDTGTGTFKTHREDDDPGVAIRRIAARLRTESYPARGDDMSGRVAAETTPSREPLLAGYR